MVSTAALSNGTSSCGCIKRSAGEKLIEKYLAANKFKFEREYKIPDCKNKRPLPFDFCVFLDKEYLIEFQGKHHYSVVKRFGEKKHLETIQNDKIKLNYCIEKEVPFLPIPYTEISKIDKLLEGFLCQIHE